MDCNISLGGNEYWPQFFVYIDSLSLKVKNVGYIKFIQKIVNNYNDFNNNVVPEDKEKFKYVKVNNANSTFDNTV